MRTAITFIRRRGAEKSDLLFGMETPIDEQERAVKNLIGAGKENADFESIEFWSSDSGRMKRFEFREPAPAPVILTDLSQEVLSEAEQAALDEKRVAEELTEEEELAASERLLNAIAEQEKKNLETPSPQKPSADDVPPAAKNQRRNRNRHRR